MRQVRIGEVVPLNDGTYMAVSYSDGLLSLRSLETGTEVRLDPGTVAIRWQEAREREQAPQPRTLDLVTPEARRLALVWADHLEEVSSGRRLGGVEGEPRPVYDPRLPLADRLANKSAEMRSIGLPCSTSTLKRRLRAYRAAGTAGLLDGRRLRKDPPFARADPRLIDALATVIAGETNQSTGTHDRLRLRLKKELLLNHPGEGVTVPPRTTLWRYTTIMSEGKHTFGSATTRRSAATVPNRTFAPRLRFMPGQEVQMDTTRLDVLVRDPRGKPQQPLLTIMVDTATENIIASTIRIRGTKGFDHAVALARCLVPRTLRPGYERLKSFAAASHSGNMVPDMSRSRSGEGPTRPFIFPHRIVTDNGRDYLSEVFRAACAKYGISLTEASLHTGSDKSLVERTFESIKTGFSQYIPGYTGGSVSMRGPHPEEEDLLDIYTLNEVFEDWVDSVWQSRQRRGLSAPLLPGMTLSARAVTLAMAEVAGEIPIPFTQDDYIDLMPIHLLTIQPKGITHGGRTYDSVRLFPFRFQPCPETHNRQWPVRYNPYDPFAVWIKNPDDGMWIECVWTKAAALNAPFSSFVWRESRRIAQEIGVLDDDAAVELTMNVVLRGKQEQDRMANMEARSEVALRIEQDGLLPMPEPQPVGDVDGSSALGMVPVPGILEAFDPERDLI